MFSSKGTNHNRGMESMLFYVISLCVLMVLTASSPVQTVKRDTLGRFSRQSVDLEGLGRLLESLDLHLENFQKRTCSVGINANNCILSDLSKAQQMNAFHASSYSPGKRSGISDVMEGQVVAPEDIVEETKALHDDVTTQRQIIWRLKDLLERLRQDKEEREPQKTKKSCRFRLGGHCLTEELNKAAAHLRYLHSPDSPGRRRRRSSKGMPLPAQFFLASSNKQFGLQTPNEDNTPQR